MKFFNRIIITTKSLQNTAISCVKYWWDVITAILLIVFISVISNQFIGDIFIIIITLLLIKRAKICNRKNSEINVGKLGMTLHYKMKNILVIMIVMIVWLILMRHYLWSLV